MKTTRLSRSTRGPPAQEIAKLKARLADAEETLRAIRTGEVDTVMVAGKEGSQVFTLEGAEHAYRVLIESMNEGALTLTSGKTILYANQRFARMVKCRLDQVIGSSFRRFLSREDRATLRPLMKHSAKTGSKMQVTLHASDGLLLPVQISVREITQDSSHRITIGMVVTDMTEARRSEELLRALAHRVVQVQEAERGRVALELHDGITQLLCAMVFRSEAFMGRFMARDSAAKREAVKILAMLGRAAEEVERISRNLRPSVLEQLGLAAVLRDTSREFTERTGVPVQLSCAPFAARLPADIELTLYRILQETLKNAELHARARHVAVSMRRHGGHIQLKIKDDGIGFYPEQRVAGQREKGNLGLVSMRERAAYVGGTLTIKSVRGVGTEVDVRIPLAPRATIPEINGAA
jgi:PAS domain S-box-containing protein